MKQEKLNLYQIDIKYIRNLHHIDDRVPSISPQIGKHGKLLGVLNYNLMIPVTEHQLIKLNLKSVQMTPHKIDFTNNYVSMNLPGAKRIPKSL